MISMSNQLDRCYYCLIRVESFCFYIVLIVNFILVGFFYFFWLKSKTTTYTIDKQTR